MVATEGSYRVQFYNYNYDCLSTNRHEYSYRCAPAACIKRTRDIIGRWGDLNQQRRFTVMTHVPPNAFYIRRYLYFTVLCILYPRLDTPGVKYISRSSERTRGMALLPGLLI